MKAVILAGGLETRSPIKSKSYPKVMVSVLDKPLLWYHIELLKKHNIKDIWICLNLYPEQVIDYFGDGSNFGVSIHYSLNSGPYGTAGALRNPKSKIEASLLGDDNFIVTYGDNFTDFDYTDLVSFHSKNKALMSLGLYTSDLWWEKGVVSTDKSGKVLEFMEKPPMDKSIKTQDVNAGIYVCQRQILDIIPKDQSSDFGFNIIPDLLKNGKKIYAINTNSFIEDIGTHKGLEKFRTEILNKKKRAIILDRDGVINKKPKPQDYVKKLSELEILPESAAAVKVANDLGFVVIVISNQRGIARGLMLEKDLLEIHNHINQEFEKSGAKIDAFFVCMHDFLDKCDCRKPEPGLIKQAVEQFNIDLDDSWLIGDAESDLMAGINAGMKRQNIKIIESDSPLLTAVREIEAELAQII